MYMYMYKQTAVRYFFKIISKNEDKALFFLRKTLACHVTRRCLISIDA